MTGVFVYLTSIVLFVAAAIYMVISSRRHPGREESVYLDGRGPEPAAEELDEESGEGSDEASDDGSDEGAEDVPEDGTDAAEDADPQDESSDDEPVAGKVSTDD